LMKIIHQSAIIAMIKDTFRLAIQTAMLIRVHFVTP